MPIVTLNTNSSLGDIVQSHNGGSNKQYIVFNNSKKKLDVIVNTATQLSKTNPVIFIEVKFASKYSQREKRIEIVTRQANTITFYKISNPTEYDKDAIEIDRLCTEAHQLYSDFQFCAIVLLSTNKLQELDDSIKDITTAVQLQSF